MANQTVVSASAIWQAYFDKLTETGTEFDFIKTGEVYFVECNAGNDDYDGHDWKHALKTLEQAIKLSNASIANSPIGYGRGWAARNKIYIKADACGEDLTTGATKCDIIGVGSCDAEPRARITGEHTFTGGSTQLGMRFFNIEFYQDDTSAIFTLTTPQGIEFHNCIFTEQTSCTNAIVTGGAIATNMVIKNCIFRSRADGVRFATSAIDLSAVLTYGFVMEDCVIEGAVALDIDSTSCFQAYVRNCLFIATTYCVDDDSNDVYYENCHFISDVNNTTDNDTIVNWNVAKAINCQVTGSNHTDNMPLVVA